MYSSGFITDCQRGRLLDSYFYVIGISYDKTHFTCIWVNLSRFKMNIKSDYIEDIEINQELSRKAESIGLDTSSIIVNLLRFTEALYLS